MGAQLEDRPTESRSGHNFARRYRGGAHRVHDGRKRTVGFPRKRMQRKFYPLADFYARGTARWQVDARLERTTRIMQCRKQLTAFDELAATDRKAADNALPGRNELGRGLQPPCFDLSQNFLRGRLCLIPKRPDA